MIRRVISGARSVSGTDHDIRGPRARRGKLVIADWGPTAELLVFPAGETVGLGAEFQYSGSIWVITGSQRDSRIMVAEPMTH
jgi:hypothetical protein